MGSKRKGGVCYLNSSSEEDESSDGRKRPVWQTFRIHSSGFVTESNRDERKRGAINIPYDVTTSESKIRDMLISKLPQLKDKSFRFFTKDKTGRWYFCPCSLQCEGKDHSAESWNGTNIPRAAKSNRTVYILIESTTVEETRSGGVQNDTLTNPVPSDSQLRGSVGQYSSNPLNQKEGRVPKNHQSVCCPDLSLSGLEHQDSTSVQPLSANHGNADFNQWPKQLTQPSQKQTVLETEYEKVKDGVGVTEEKDGEGEGRIEISNEEMQTDVWKNDIASTSENLSPQMYFESGYDTFSSEKNALVLVDPANSVQDEVPQTFFVNNSPPLDTNLNGTSLHPTPTEFMQIFQDFPRTPPEIKEIVPDRGNVAGGQTFYLSLAENYTIHDIQVQFGPSIIPVERCGDKDFKGIVPPYPEADVVQVYLVNNRLERMSNFKPFEYIDPDKAKEDFVKKDINSRKDFEEMLFLLSKKVGKINLNSNETKDSQGTNKPGGGKTQALSLLYMIANTAAMLNAIDFYRVIFSTQAGHSVFKSGKDAQTPLEEIARENGHEELARLLEQKHLMYQDDENESDDEVDWKELARAIEKYQTLMGQTAEKKSIPSTSSSEQIQGYLGDGESSTSLSSLHLLDVECCTESTFEDQQTTQESMCGEEPNTSQSTAAEDCPESTFEEQQTTLESTCEEEPDTCQTIGRIAIRDGMSDTDIINTMSSSDQLRMNKAHQVKESQSSIGEKNELANIHVNPLHLVVSGPIIMSSFQMDKFAPKEISSLRRKLGSFDAAKMNPSALYPDGDQAIYNLMERLDTAPESDFLEKLKQDSTRGLNAQKGSQHPETAEKELCDAKRKGATVMKTESIASVYSSVHSKVESGVEIATLAGSESNISLEEQSTEVEISQDARFFDERKSACLSFLRTRRLACACLLTSMLTILVCLATIFTLRASTKTQTPTTTPTAAVETMTSSRQACSNGLLTLLCEGVTDLNAVHELRWKINFPDAGWNEFAYCGKSGMNCIVTRPELPEGIKVLEVSNRSVNIQRVAKNNTSGYAQIMFQVLYSDNSRTSHVYKINFTAKCVRIHEHRDLNLTKILQSFVQCESAVDIEWYSINGSKFVHCSTCQDCKKISEVNREHVFWSRLKVARGSLLLTAIRGSDDGWTIRVKVHMKASGKSAGRDVEANMESAHMYTIWIFVNTSRPPVPEKEIKSLCGSPVKLQAPTSRCSGCKNDEVTWRRNDAALNDMCLACIDCPDGMEPSIPCGTVVKYGTHLQCVACKEGTFSDSYDKGQCKPCTVCSTGRTVARNCSGTKNTQCGTCSHGYYESEVVFDCLPCSVCCWDGRDQLESQCKAQGLPRYRNCKPRYEPGCQTPWSSSGLQATTGAITKRPNQGGTKKDNGSNTIATKAAATTTTTEEKAASLSPTTEEIFISTLTGDQNTNSHTLSPTSTELPKRTASATYSDSKISLAVKKSKGSFLDSSDENKNRVIKAVGLSIPILILIVVILKRKKLGAYFKWARSRFTSGRRSSDAELGGATESSVLDAIKVQSGSIVSKGALIPMRELKLLSFDTYERVWKRLDKQPEGARKGNFKHVAAEFLYAQEDIWELEKELKTLGSGSPSRQLLDGLETRRPELTVLEFVEVLQKPNIQRDDIVKLLNDYIYR